jgi:ArsR family transcriptional regulator, cadmium/lead-responsive transcriptional repressor
MTAVAQRSEQLWAAIGEPTRRRIVDLLLERGDASASALAAEMPVTRQAVAKHLTVLERAGLVTGSRQGREVLWSVRPGVLDEATAEMNRIAARWDRRLGRIKEIAEAIHAERSKTEDNEDNEDE